MLALNADDNVVGLDDAPQHVVYIGADALLKLKAPADGVGDAGQLRQADNAALGDIADSDSHIVHEGDVMLAKAEHVDVLDDDHIAVIAGKHLVEFPGDFFVGNAGVGQPFFHHLGKTLRRLLRPVAAVLPDGFQNQRRRLL